MKKIITNTVKPVGNNILIKPVDGNRDEIDGIYVPDNAKETPLEYEVVALGSADFNVKIGDIILPTKYDSGNEVLIEGKMHKLITEEDILAII
jgi:chaperonin GroES